MAKRTHKKTSAKDSDPMGRGREVPTLKPGRYTDGLPLDEIQYLECKLILKPNGFTSRKRLFGFGKVMRGPAEESGVEFLTKGFADEPLRIREILFLDTADFRFYNNAFILRRRIPYEGGFPTGDPELVFKFRHPDTTALWILIVRIGETNPIWAIASMIASSDPQVKEAARIFKSRLINVLVGCAVGFLFLLVGGSSEWKLPLALSVTVLVSSYLVHEHTMWRQAPITAAIIVAGGLTHRSKLIGVEYGLHKVAEVFLGCLMGLLVSFLMSRVWPQPEAAKKAAAH